jgi:hypothetical protein
MPNLDINLRIMPRTTSDIWFWIIIPVTLFVGILRFSNSQDVIAWDSGHYHCFGVQHRHIDRDSKTTTQSSPHTHFTTSSFHRIDEHSCVPLSYLTFFQHLLHNSTNEAEKKIAQHVISLYHDLEIRRRPIILKEAYLVKHMPSLPSKFEEWQKHQSPSNHLNFSSFDIRVSPISFGVDERLIVSIVPPKSKPLGKVIPGYPATYLYGRREDSYYRDIEDSMFYMTFKKGGWDCLRHVEILARGSVPFFPDIKDCPAGALAAHPKRLYRTLLDHPGLFDIGPLPLLREPTKNRYNWTKLEVHPEVLDSRVYFGVANALLVYTKNVLSSRSMADFMLSRIIEDIHLFSNRSRKSTLLRKVLYCGPPQDEAHQLGDYLIDTLAHGLKDLLGEDSVVDYPPRFAIYKDVNQLTEEGFFQRRGKFYGNGYTYTMKVPTYHAADYNSSTADDQLRREVEDMISQRKFDVIIMHSAGNFPVFWQSHVCKYYQRHEVAIMHGSDGPLDHGTVEGSAMCARHFFAREGFPLR